MFSMREETINGKTVIIHEQDGVKTLVDAPDMPPSEPRQEHFDYCVAKIREAGLQSGPMPVLE